MRSLLNWLCHVHQASDGTFAASLLGGHVYMILELSGDDEDDDE